MTIPADATDPHVFAQDWAVDLLVVHGLRAASPPIPGLGDPDLPAPLPDAVDAAALASLDAATRAQWAAAILRSYVEAEGARAVAWALQVLEGSR